MPPTRYTNQEIARIAEDIYRRDMRPKAMPQHKGSFSSPISNRATTTNLRRSRKVNRLFWTGIAILCLAGTALSGPARAGQGPFVGGGQADAKDPKVTKLEAAAAKLEKQWKARPKDARLKLRVAEAYYTAGHEMMMSPKLPPRIKYRGALKHFRKALTLNPKHARAANEKKTIEDIYKSMGRPVPQ